MSQMRCEAKRVITCFCTMERCALCGFALFRNDSQLCSVLSCFHLVCSTCLDSHARNDRTSCPVCGADAECLTADSDALLFKSPEYLSHMLASAAESLAFQNAVLGKMQERSAKRGPPEPAAPPVRSFSPVALGSAAPRALNARLSMKTGGAAPGAAAGPKKPKLEKIHDYGVPSVSVSHAPAKESRQNPPPKEMIPAFRRAKPQVFEQ